MWVCDTEEVCRSATKWCRGLKKDNEEFLEFPGMKQLFLFFPEYSTCGWFLLITSSQVIEDSVNLLLILCHAVDLCSF